MRCILIITFCLFFFDGFGQTITFNKRVQIGCVNTILSGLEVTDSCFYVIAHVRDTFNCNKSTAFIKFDSLGDVLFSRILYDSFGYYGSWQPSLRTDIDGNLVVSTYFTDTANALLGGILKYNTTGDLIWHVLHNTPYPTENFMRPDDMQVTQDSGYILVTTVNRPMAAADMTILKLDKNGNEDWHIIKGGAIYAERYPCVYTDSDGSYVVGYQQDNLSDVFMNYTVRSKLEKVDSAGNSIWTYQSPSNEQIYGVNDLIKSKDGGWVVASAFGYEKLGANGSWSYFLHDSYVYKLDSARNLLWGKVFYSGSEDKAAFTKIIELEDSSLVAFGTILRLYPQPNPTYYIIHGRIVKLSPQGDSLWNREYEYLTTGSGIVHSIYDAERTHDGGFLICGEAKGTGSGVYQQGWLLKLDEHGCLVPGCQLPLGVLPVRANDDSSELRLYPNPTTDYLNVHYLASKVGAELTFSVIDMQGRVLQTYRTADVSDKTYIVPVYDLVAGVYVLEVRRDGELVKSEQFVKQ